MLHLANTSLGVDADTKKNMVAQIEQLADGHANRAILLQQVRGAIAQLAGELQFSLLSHVCQRITTNWRSLFSEWN